MVNHIFNERIIVCVIFSLMFDKNPKSRIWRAIFFVVVKKKMLCRYYSLLSRRCGYLPHFLHPTCLNSRFQRKILDVGSKILCVFFVLFFVLFFFDVRQTQHYPCGENGMRHRAPGVLSHLISFEIRTALQSWHAATTDWATAVGVSYSRILTLGFKSLHNLHRRM